MDPQQRELFKTVFKTFEASELDINKLKKINVDVFCGQIESNWPNFFIADHQVVPSHSATENACNIITNQVFYFFNWHSPLIIINTACSSSLVALHQTGIVLQQKKYSVAIAANTNLLLDPSFFIVTTKMTMLSPKDRDRI